MESIILKIAAILLGVLILFSSFGFTVSTHFCGGEKIKSAVGFVKTDLTCGMKKETSKCPQHNQIQSECCKNVFEYHKIEDNVKKEVAEIAIPKFIQVFQLINLGFLVQISLDNIYFNNFSPPLIVKNITVVFQTFLI